MDNHTRIVLQAVRMAHNAIDGYYRASYLIIASWGFNAGQVLLNAFLDVALFLSLPAYSVLNHYNSLISLYKAHTSVLIG